MTVEALVRWTELKMNKPPMSADEIAAERAINGVDPSHNTPEIFYSFSPMCFEMEDVARFNKSNDEGCTTIRFKDGDGYVVKVEYKQFRELYTDCTGKSVLSIIEQEPTKEEKPKRKRKGGDAPPSIPPI